MPNDPLLSRREALARLTQVILPDYAVALLDSGQLTVIRVKRSPRYLTSEIEGLCAAARELLAEAGDGD